MYKVEVENIDKKISKIKLFKMNTLILVFIAVPLIVLTYEGTYSGSIIVCTIFFTVGCVKYYFIEPLL